MEKSENNSVGSFIAILRKSKGYTQQVLAEKLGVSSKTISKWECDEGMPDIMILPSLAQTLGASIEELLAGKRYQNSCDAAKRDTKTLSQLKSLFRYKETRFKNISFVSLALSVMAIILQIAYLFLLLTSEFSIIMYVFAIALTLSGVVCQAINTLSATNAVNIDSENIADIEFYADCKKAMKTTIYNWSYCVFALTLIGAILCVVPLFLGL